MANVTISNICNLNCPYCFASAHMEKTKKARAAFISQHRFSKRLDFLDRSGIQQIRLIGGEPTLHPHFPDLIDQAIERGLKLLIFSHGLMPERSLRSLENLPIDKIQVLINTNATRAIENPTPCENEQRRVTFQRLGRRAIPGFNIFQANFNLEPIMALIHDTDCCPVIRLGLAQPLLVGSNHFLHTKDYPHVGRRLVYYAQEAAQQGIRLEFDCGFVRCMFSDTEITVLKKMGTDIGWRCNPILDIGIEGNAIHCFPLSNKWRIPVDDDSVASNLRQAFDSWAKPYRMTGIYRDCSTCTHKRAGNCRGGCLAHTLRRFRQHHFEINVTE